MLLGRSQTYLILKFKLTEYLTYQGKLSFHLVWTDQILTCMLSKKTS